MGAETGDHFIILPLTTMCSSHILKTLSTVSSQMCLWRYSQKSACSRQCLCVISVRIPFSWNHKQLTSLSSGTLLISYTKCPGEAARGSVVPSGTQVISSLCSTLGSKPSPCCGSPPSLSMACCAPGLISAFQAERGMKGEGAKGFLLVSFCLFIWKGHRPQELMPISHWPELYVLSAPAARGTEKLGIWEIGFFQLSTLPSPPKLRFSKYRGRGDWSCFCHVCFQVIILKIPII